MAKTANQLIDEVVSGNSTLLVTVKDPSYDLKLFKKGQKVLFVRLGSAENKGTLTSLSNHSLDQIRGMSISDVKEISATVTFQTTDFPPVFAKARKPITVKISDIRGQVITLASSASIGEAVAGEDLGEGLGPEILLKKLKEAEKKAIEAAAIIAEIERSGVNTFGLGVKASEFSARVSREVKKTGGNL